MKFGVLKDTKLGEYRVVATPAEVHSISARGHSVFIQSRAGVSAGFSDRSYQAVGATIVDSAQEIYQLCDIVAKVKEFDATDYPHFRENQILFSCIHPAAHPEEVAKLLEKKVIAFTAEDSHRHGSPNCEAAGKLGAVMGITSLLNINGGNGKFIGGLSGAPSANVIILGAGLVGKSALSVIYGLGGKTTVLDLNLSVLRDIEKQYSGHVNTLYSTKYNIESLLPQTDLLINSVKWPKQNKDYLITRKMIKTMKPRSVIVDISNDYGVIETFKETTHENPRYVEEGVVHYCVSNIPGAMANTTSTSYAACLLPHFLNIMDNGVKAACSKDGYLRRSLTVYKGHLTHEETSAIQSIPWIRPEDILEIDYSSMDAAPPATSTRSNLFEQLKK